MDKLKELVYLILSKMKSKPEHTYYILLVIILFIIIKIIFNFSLLPAILCALMHAFIILRLMKVRKSIADEKRHTRELVNKQEEKNLNEIQNFLEDINNEQKTNLQLFINSAENNFIVKLKCPIKLYKTEGYVNLWEENIDCYINLMEEYFYIIPVNIKENALRYKGYQYHFVEDYRRLMPNYKNLFFKIHINDIKFYKQNGTVYANTQGNIGSEYAWGNFILTRDSEYKTKGSISTTLKDTRTTEFYYNDNGIIKTLIFDGESLTKLQLIIPDKEKK